MKRSFTKSLKDTLVFIGMIVIVIIIILTAFLPIIICAFTLTWTPMFIYFVITVPIVFEVMALKAYLHFFA